MSPAGRQHESRKGRGRLVTRRARGERARRPIQNSGFSNATVAARSVTAGSERSATRRIRTERQRARDQPESIRHRAAHLLGEPRPSTHTAALGLHTTSALSANHNGTAHERTEQRRRQRDEARNERVASAFCRRDRISCTSCYCCTSPAERTVGVLRELWPGVRSRRMLPRVQPRVHID